MRLDMTEHPAVRAVVVRNNVREWVIDAQRVVVSMSIQLQGHRVYQISFLRSVTSCACCSWWW